MGTITEQKLHFDFEITGMDCANCATTLENGVRRMPGVVDCELNFTTGNMRVNGSATREDIIHQVRDLGYDVAQENITTAPARPDNFWQYMKRRPETRLALIGAQLILPGLIFNELLGMHNFFIDLASVGALFTAGLPVFRSAWRGLRANREITINLLMSIAAIGALLIGAVTEAGMVMVLFAIGEALEGYTADRARQTIRSLMQVAPSTATRLQAAEGQMVERCVAVTDLLVSDRIIIHPGERIPMDGRVLIGESAVNQAAITGESLPVEKTIESMVYAGSINGHGSLEVEVTHLAKDNTISRMIRLVEEAQEKRAPSQRFVDRFARVYTPLVTLLALLVVVIPTVFFGQPLFNPAPGQFGWLYRGLALLVVACPCALVISTPVSIISAINNAARHQVLIKGGAALEMLSRVKVIGLDKTGTVTLGDPQVVRIRAMDCRNGHENGVCTCAACQDLLAVAAALEKRSEHPLGKAIVKAADEFGLGDRYAPGLDVKALAGMGIRGRVNGQMVYIASHAICDDEDCHPQEDCEAAAADAGSGGTPVLVHVDDMYRGTITLADTVRPSSRQAVNELHLAGLKVEMLTGDHQATAEHIARMAGLNGVRAGLLPEDKVNAVRQLREKYGRVAMVGDGINDAPALAASDVGIAMGGANGTAQAMEAGDITLMSADLGRLPYVIQLSRSAMNTIRVNVVLSIGIKLAFMALVVLGLGTMWMAVLADMGTSLLVTLNGMRLLGSSDAG